MANCFSFRKFYPSISSSLLVSHEIHRLSRSGGGVFKTLSGIWAVTSWPCLFAVVDEMLPSYISGLFQKPMEIRIPECTETPMRQVKMLHVIVRRFGFQGGWDIWDENSLTHLARTVDRRTLSNKMVTCSKKHVLDKKLQIGFVFIILKQKIVSTANFLSTAICLSYQVLQILGTWWPTSHRYKMVQVWCTPKA